MVNIISETIKSDVTAIEYLGGCIVIGAGNYLQIFLKNGTFLQSYKVFCGQKIHGIIPSSNNHLAIFGGNCLKILEYRLPEFIFEPVITSMECEDWIMTIQWLECEKKFLTVFANNYVALWNLKCELLEKIACEQRCIIYSTFIVNHLWNELFVLSGTVFNEILIWKPSNSSNKLSKVITRLKGHDGVIFSINYNKSLNLIATTSDDRTVRLWYANNIFSELPDVIELYPKTTIYGHTARVFRCKLTKNYVISTGEDSSLCIWNFEGKLIRKFANHGSSLWALHCCEEENFILTGGSNGTVSVYPIEVNKNVDVLSFSTDLVPRSLKFLKSGSIVLIVDSGLLKYKSRENEFKDIFLHNDLKNYAVLETNENFAALSGINGSIHIYKEQNDNLTNIFSSLKIVNGRIYSVNFLSNNKILISHENGNLDIFNLYETDKFSLEHEESFELPVSKERWATCAVLCADKIVVGNRKGNLYVFVSGQQNPVQSIKKSQNYRGITSLNFINNQLISFGRTGIVKKYNFNSSGLLNHTSNDKLPFSWLTSIVKRNDVMLYLGFSGSDFIIWDHNNRKILLDLNCGGGHRSWDFLMLENSISFIYIKEKCVNYYTSNWNNIFILDIMKGLHVKEINSVKTIQISDKKLILLSGGEDTTIKLSLLDLNHSKTLQTLSTLKVHLSSVRCINLFHRFTEIQNENKTERYFMFTAGGRAQIILWELNLCVSSTNHKYEHKQLDMYHKILDENESEMRVMDLASLKFENNLFLIAACSDGMLKFYLIENFKLIFIKNVFYGSKCIMKIVILKIKNTEILISMATDGKLTFWNLTDFFQTFKEIYNNSSEFKTMQSFYSFRVHQTGINSIDYKLMSDTLLIATGGDDSVISLNKFKFEISDKIEISHLKNWVNKTAHASQINGIFLTETHILVSSLDQNVSVFKYGKDLQGQLLKQYCSVIDDIQGFNCICLNKDTICMCLFGNGIEVCTVYID